MILLFKNFIETDENTYKHCESINTWVSHLLINNFFLKNYILVEFCQAIQVERTVSDRIAVQIETAYIF
jgi:hypothetical protein